MSQDSKWEQGDVFAERDENGQVVVGRRKRDGRARSNEARASVDMTKRRWEVLAYMATRTGAEREYMTSDRISYWMERSPSGTRTRLIELVRDGFLAEGEESKTRFGRKCATYYITQAGLRRLAKGFDGRGA